MFSSQELHRGSLHLFLYLLFFRKMVAQSNCKLFRPYRGVPYQGIVFIERNGIFYELRHRLLPDFSIQADLGIRRSRHSEQRIEFEFKVESKKCLKLQMIYGPEFCEAEIGVSNRQECVARCCVT